MTNETDKKASSEEDMNGDTDRDNIRELLVDHMSLRSNVSANRMRRLRTNEMLSAKLSTPFAYDTNQSGSSES